MELVGKLWINPNSALEWLSFILYILPIACFQHIKYVGKISIMSLIYISSEVLKVILIEND